MRWDERQRLKAIQEERQEWKYKKLTLRSVKVGQRPMSSTAKKMRKHVEDSEAFKVSTRELVEQVMSPHESNVQFCAYCEAGEK